MWSADIFVGVHGSALVNAFFMHPGAVLVELAPFKVDVTGFFGPAAVDAGLHYLRWTNRRENQTVMHWHFARPGQGPEDESLAANPDALVGVADPDFFSRWINQDTLVPLDEWDALLREAEALACGPPPTRA